MNDNSYYDMYITNFNINLLDCKFIGKGHNGTVFLLPDSNKIIKICTEEESCISEYDILEKVNGNKYFPKVYGMCGNYMIRDYVTGEILKDYIKKNGLTKEMSIKIIELLEEFNKLKFTKQDIRCKDIIVQKDGTLKVIDPKNFYNKHRIFPRHLSKGLYKLGVIDYFLDTMKKERYEQYKKWNGKIRNYIKYIKYENR